MRIELRFGLMCVALFTLLYSCAGSPEPVSVEDQQRQEGKEQPPSSEPEATEEPSKERAQTETEEPKSDVADREPESEPESEPEEESPSAPEEPEEPIEVSDEVYDATFEEIERVIEELNAAIAERDVEKWKEYLTEDYVAEYSDEQRLEEISQRPILAQNDITLNSLEDYFNEVVVPSRRNARLDDLRFLDEDEVQAVMHINDTSVILYRLKKVDGSWKVDVG